MDDELRLLARDLEVEPYSDITVARFIAKALQSQLPDFPDLADAAFSNWMAQFDVPYMTSHDNLHVIPIIQDKKRFHQYVFFHKKTAPAYPKDIFKTLLDIRNTIIPDHDVLVRAIENYLKNSIALQDDWSLKIIPNRTESEIPIVGYRIMGRPSQQIYTIEWNSSYASSYHTILIINRTPYRDRMYFRIDDNLRLSGGGEIQGLHLSGAGYLQYGAGGPHLDDWEEDERQEARRDDEVHSIPELLKRIQFYLTEAAYLFRIEANISNP